VLRHAEDAEDAFQATFLLLACKAAAVSRREALAGWLHAVAYRTALRAKARAVRRRSRERQVEQMPHPEVAPAEPQDWRPLLDRELAALPEKYRAALALCDLEGRPRREAARQLGVSEGTLSSRLARGRCLLARRLERRGLGLSGGAVAAALAGGAATAAVPARLALRTARAAAGHGAATPAAVLMHEVQRGMLMAKLKVCAAVAAAAVVLGTGGLAYRAAGQAPRPDKSAEVRAPAEMELLRKEVELLKLQVELLQEKARAQGAELRAQGTELRALRGQGGAPRTTVGRALNQSGPSMPELAPSMQGAANTTPLPTGGRAGMTRGALPGTTVGPPANGPPTMMPRGGALGRPANVAGVEPTTPGDLRGGGPTAEEEAEAALKALRAARDPEARRRAAEALEKAAKKLRGQSGRGAPGDPLLGRN
jgi:RNA polymerase sigma factor (sigma-70 family)